MEKLLRIQTILNEYIPICRTSFYELIKQGDIPEPRKIGRTSLWKLSDIQNFINKSEE